MPLNYDFAISEAPGLDRLAHFRDPATVAALNEAPQAVRDFLTDCGFAASAYDSGAPRGAYWSTEESTRLAIMERMSEALDRYRLPNPGEVPEDGFNLSHLFAAMMSAEPVQRPPDVVPDPVQVAAARALTLPPGPAEADGGRASAAAAAAPQAPRPGAGRVSAGLAAVGAGRPAGPAPGASPTAQRPAWPVAPPSGTGGAERAAAPAETAAARPGGVGAEAVPRRPTHAAPRDAGPGLGPEVGLGPRPGGAGTGQRDDPAQPGAVPDPASPAALPVAERGRAQGAGMGQLRGILMLGVGVALLAYALINLF